jgi:hypothetical protein
LHHKITTSGSKPVVIQRIYCYLRLGHFAVKIQKIVRGIIQRDYNNLHGPALFRRHLCTNNTDFFTMEDLSDIPHSQFFSFKDVDNFIYGFDIVSFYNLIQKSEREVMNPYNRTVIPKKVVYNIRLLLRLAKVLKTHVETKIQDTLGETNDRKTIELRALGLFQKIDSLGHYSDPAWFNALNRSSMIRFMRELIDIWHFRAQINIQTKMAICPQQNGNPFRHFSMNYAITEVNFENVRKYVLEVLENLVNSGVDEDSKRLGAYYILGALTLVSEPAATAIPWLFEAFSY